MIKHFIIGFVVAVTSTCVFAQRNPKIDKDEFFNKEEGAYEASIDLKKGEKFFKKGKGFYDEALKYYLKAYNYNSSNAVLNYKIGICELLSSDRASSLNYLLQSNMNVANDYYLRLGRAYQYNNRFASAISSYNNYLSVANKRALKRDRSRVEQYIDECNYAQSIMKDSVAVFITNLGPLINTYYDDYNAMLSYGDSMVLFTSRRPDKEPHKRESRFKYREQIYAVNNCLEDECDSLWGFKSLSYGKNLSLAGISKSEDRIFFFKGKRNNGTIYTAVHTGNGWSQKRKVKGKVNHVAYKEGSLSVDKNNTIYFVSNRREGYGGTDIWMATYKKKNRWNKPINLGRPVNTLFDEESVYVNEDGTELYFSSNGHKGFGGYDVYKSILLSDSSWSEPQNIGYPINSPADELFYYKTSNPNIAFYATMRKGGYGGLDIYKIVNDLRKPFYYTCTGVDVEDGTKIPISYSIVNDSTKEMMYSDISDPKGNPTSHFFEDHGKYIISYNSEGYHAYTDTIVCPNDKYVTASQEFKLEKLRHPFTISGVVSDLKKGEPVGAKIEFRDYNGNLLASTTSSSITGKYAYSFEDKIDFVIEARAKDFCDTTATVLATQSADAQIKQDVKMRLSKTFFTICGTVRNESDQSPVAAALHFYPVGSTTEETVAFSDSASSKYTGRLLTKGPYWIDIEAIGYFFLNDAIQFDSKEQVLTRNYTLKKMESGVKIVIENILFNTGKSTLKPSSFEELDKFAKLLIKNPTVCIEVSGHTDNVGAASYNKKLSKDRALTVKNYLVNKGVEDERITYAGYGFDQPIESNATAAGREKNRRVEIKVLK